MRRANYYKKNLVIVTNLTNPKSTPEYYWDKPALTTPPKKMLEF